MKKMLLIAMLLGFLSESHAQQVNTKRRTVVYNSTADWCPPCGEWGWKITDSLYHRWKTDTTWPAYIIGNHSESNQAFLNSSMAEIIDGIAQPFPVNSFPSFIIDNQDMVDITDWIDFDFLFNNTDTIDRALDSLEKYIKLETAGTADAGIGATVWQTATDSLYVKTKVRFQKNVSGDYRLAVHVVEDSVMGTQTSMSGIVPHHMVLREPMETTTFGYTLPGGSFTVTQEFNYTYKMKLPTSWNKKRLHYMVVVYKVDIPNTTAEIANVYMTNALLSSQPPTGVEEAGMEHGMEVYPNPVRNQVNLRLPASGEYRVYLSDLSGKKVADIHFGKIGANEILTLQVPLAVVSGTYMLHAAAQGRVFSSVLKIE